MANKRTDNITMRNAVSRNAYTKNNNAAVVNNDIYISKNNSAEKTSESSLKEVLNNLYDLSLAKNLSKTQQAYKAWFSVNGTFEKNHTCGLFLKKDERSNVDPTLIVYIDKHTILQDFTTNKEIYLVRLAHAGFMLSDIQFKLSKIPKKINKSEVKSKNIQKFVTDFEPTEEQLHHADQLTKNLPTQLKEKVYKAIISSLKREMTNDTSTS